MSDVRVAMTQQTNPVKVIREKCLDCCNGAYTEVDRCTVKLCPLWPFRYGTNQHRRKRVLTAAQKAKASANLQHPTK